MGSELKKQQVSIVGLGLIGGSLALGLKEAGFKKTVGTSGSSQTMQTAKNLGMIDRIASSVEEAVEGSDIVFICTPILTIENVFRKIASYLKRGCIVTDVASTKEKIVKLAENILPTAVSFIGGHPMAGKEKSGIEHAEKDLFKNCKWCLVPTSLTNRESLLELKELIIQLQAKPIVLDAETHDKAVASISHLPFLLSMLLVNTASSLPSWRIAVELTASGFKDVSRLAAGDIRMHTEICLTNRDNIVKVLDDFLKKTRNLKRILQADNKEQLIQFMQKTKRIRDNLYAERRDGEN